MFLLIASVSEEMSQDVPLNLKTVFEQGSHQVSLELTSSLYRSETWCFFKSHFNLSFEKLKITSRLFTYACESVSSAGGLVSESLRVRIEKNG
jgi:hypothetical protein